MFYNRAVTNVDPAGVHNVYNYQVAVGFHDRVSYNGGRGGLTARPTPQESAVTTSRAHPRLALRYNIRSRRPRIARSSPR